jgi:hypothetical protein
MFKEEIYRQRILVIARELLRINRLQLFKPLTLNAVNIEKTADDYMLTARGKVEIGENW